MAVLDPPCGAAVLPRHPRRLRALLEKARLIYHKHCLRIAQMRHHVPLEIVAHGVRVPACGIEQALHAIGGMLTEGLGELPAILALDLSEQAVEIAAGTGAHFGAVETGGDHGMEGVKGRGNGRDNHGDKLLSVPSSLSLKCCCSTKNGRFAWFTMRRTVTHPRSIGRDAGMYYPILALKSVHRDLCRKGKRGHILTITATTVIASRGAQHISGYQASWRSVTRSRSSAASAITRRDCTTARARRSAGIIGTMAS